MKQFNVTLERPKRRIVLVKPSLESNEWLPASHIEFTEPTRSHIMTSNSWKRNQAAISVVDGEIAA